MIKWGIIGITIETLKIGQCDFFPVPMSLPSIVHFHEGSDMAICTMSINHQTGGSRPHRRAGENGWRRGRHRAICFGSDFRTFPGCGNCWISTDYSCCRYSSFGSFWNCVIGIIHLAIFLEAEEVNRFRLPVGWSLQLHNRKECKGPDT